VLAKEKVFKINISNKDVWFSNCLDQNHCARLTKAQLIRLAADLLDLADKVPD
jgi:hypothetical protein